MCLSNVYRSELSDNNLMFKNIADLKLDGDTITMTNILGIPTSVRGTVKKIDLLENYIIIEPAE
ncbi:MAG: CooT family nickel-binding protein [Firmicutes bacterium]|nr:CooT family nickel-binding protein [Bacillota bacterium]